MKEETYDLNMKLIRSKLKDVKLLAGIPQIGTILFAHLGPILILYSGYRASFYLAWVVVLLVAIVIVRTSPTSSPVSAVEFLVLNHITE